VASPSGTATRPMEVVWPFAVLGCVLLTATRYAACHRDAMPYGNAWTEDHNGYCTNSAWEALTVGQGGASLRAVVLLALTAAWPATVLLVASLVGAVRDDAGFARRVWPRVAVGGAVLVVAFYFKWGHVTIVGGGGG
jgi:hypothetical protein